MSFQGSHSVRFFRYEDQTKVDKDLLIFDKTYRSIKGTGALESFSYCHPGDPETQDSISFEGLFYATQRRDYKKINPRIKKARLKKAFDQYRRENRLQENQRINKDDRILIETLVMDHMALNSPVASNFCDFMFLESTEVGKGLLFCEEPLKGGRLYDLAATANVNIQAYNPIEEFIQEEVIAKDSLMSPTRFNELFVNYLFVKIVLEEKTPYFLYGFATLETNSGEIKIGGDIERIKEEISEKTILRVKSLDLAISPEGEGSEEVLRPIRFTLKGKDSAIYAFKNPYGPNGENTTFAIEKAHELSKLFSFYRDLIKKFKMDLKNRRFSLMDLETLEEGWFG